MDMEVKGMMIYSTYTWDLAPDPKCRLSISSFLTLHDILDTNEAA